MKLIALAASLLVLTQVASALPGKTSKLQCNFTEPFFSLTVDLKSKVMVKSSYDTLGSSITTERTDVIKELIVRDGGHSNIEVLYKDKYSDKAAILFFQVATLEKGSDGMSDKVYDAAAYMTIDGNTLHGGCDFVK